MRTVVWVSGGVSSSIAAYLLRYVEGLEAYYIDIDDQHPDTMRFIKDTERVIGIPITIMKSRYSSVKYLDELDPERGRGVKEIMPECGITCELFL